MCLDCSVFRLHDDRDFEFSRADDIIRNLLEELASLRGLAEKSSGQQEQIEEACQRVEEVVRERRRQMLVELNAHCKIPGPRVKFTRSTSREDDFVSSWQQEAAPLVKNAGDRPTMGFCSCPCRCYGCTEFSEHAVHLQRLMMESCRELSVKQKIM